MDRYKLKSLAKINLTLEVVEKKKDGFHGIRSVMIKTNKLFDELDVSFDKSTSGIKIICDNENVPIDEKNICYKIARNFFEKIKKDLGVLIKIKKNIPLASGMGGGSSDGASVLLALNHYYQEILSEKELINLAGKIGKDIPFFLQSEKTAFVEGTGVEVTKIEKFPKLNILIIKPEGEISTPLAYENLDKHLSFMEEKHRENISVKMLKNINDIEKIASCLYNDFSAVAKKKYSIVELLENTLVSFGAENASITGKGPTVFGIFKTRKKLKEAEEKIRKYFSDCFICES